MLLSPAGEGAEHTFRVSLSHQSSGGFYCSGIYLRGIVGGVSHGPGRPFQPDGERAVPAVDT